MFWAKTSKFSVRFFLRPAATSELYHWIWNGRSYVFFVWCSLLIQSPIIFAPLAFRSIFWLANYSSGSPRFLLSRYILICSFQQIYFYFLCPYVFVDLTDPLLNYVTKIYIYIFTISLPMWAHVCIWSYFLESGSLFVFFKAFSAVLIPATVDVNRLATYRPRPWRWVLCTLWAASMSLDVNKISDSPL